MSSIEKKKILIVDDSEINRSILKDILEDEFDVMEASDGLQAVGILQKIGTELSLVLLDIVMPEMDGFEVLTMMNKYHWIEDIPVIMISSENASFYVEYAYEMGVTDYISRPFDTLVVRRRVVNTIMLYAKQKKLVGMVMDQIYEKQKSNNLMVEILSHIVEFRNGESGLHVIHIRTMTDLILQHLCETEPQYQMSHAKKSLIGMASALHDIGKIGISNEILNKPGKLTKEEFEIMKTHTLIGADMLKKLPFHQDEPLVKVAYEICRWHHERYDGRGYPDGLVGDEIPISAQIVALADVYDALTSERVYKKAFSHETAMEMILNGECGVFNPMLLKCLVDLSDKIQKNFKVNSLSNQSRQELQYITGEMLNNEELSASTRTLYLLEHERMKFQFFASMSQDIQFEYSEYPSMVTLSEWGAKKLGLDEVIMDPCNNPQCLKIFTKENMRELSEKICESTPENPIIQYDYKVIEDGISYWKRIICRVTWSVDEPPHYLGTIGKVIDIEKNSELIDMDRISTHDGLTGLFNKMNALKEIQEILNNSIEDEFILLIFDLDYFRKVNDQYGHVFGDQVLKCTAKRIMENIQEEDLAARVGGDKFLIFMKDGTNTRQKIKEIFQLLSSEVDGMPISVSMGVARTVSEGRDSKNILQCALDALQLAKEMGRGRCHFYCDLQDKKS